MGIWKKGRRERIELRKIFKMQRKHVLEAIDVLCICVCVCCPFVQHPWKRAFTKIKCTSEFNDDRNRRGLVRKNGNEITFWVLRDPYELFVKPFGF